MPGTDCLAYNKIQWPLASERMVLLVHDMQNYWVDLFVQPDALAPNVGTLIKSFRSAGLPAVFCRGERAKSRFERGLGLTMWGDGLNAAHVSEQDCHILCAIARRKLLGRRKSRTGSLMSASSALVGVTGSVALAKCLR
jgi:bifunctional isochorismate lyase/aryl carrier protein